MNVLLREITEDNFVDCVKLKVADNQNGFIASNVYSIAESKIYPHLIPLAVYDDENLVGFTLHGRDSETKKYWIVRLMIDKKFQGRGLGKQATLKLIEKMSEYENCDEVFLSFVPRNKSAEKLYFNIGFEKTGETDEDGEIIMCFQIKNNRQLTTDN